MENKRKILLFALLAVFLGGCIQEPELTPANNQSIQFNGEYALILCEGLLGYNNASITHFDIQEGISRIDIFEKLNNFPVGDIGNDLIESTSYYYLVVSGSKVVYKIDKKNFKVVKKLIFDGENFPRKLVVRNNNIGYLTDAYSNSIYELDLNEMKVTRSINVGPQPEGSVIAGNKLFVVNSGWGDINKNAEGASTISILDLNSFKLIEQFPTGVNPVEIQIDPKNNFYYVLFYNLPSQKDSLGGILQYELTTNSLTNIWSGNFTNLKLSSTGDSLFVLKGGFQKKKIYENNSIQVINIRNNSNSTLIANPSTNEIWYDYIIDLERKQIWISNAKNFQTEGEVEVFNINSTGETSFVKKFKTGVNPSKIIIQR